ncbi:MAG TPA: FkbM family methyltransferase [Vicinamibacterales bacterium]|nr:FkbM family methyltransferase [Vicinamibacterales bacterium]
MADFPASIARALFHRLGLHVSRLPANRWDALDDTILRLRTSGYLPRIVIDGGANVGDWTRRVQPIFPQAAYDLVEPQPACRPALEALARRLPAVRIHGVALTSPGATRLTMIDDSRGAGATGVHVATAAEAAGRSTLDVPATTLDDLFADRVSLADRALLKLDLEGHESAALAGAPRLLEAVEVLLTEVRFYDIDRSGRPVFADLLARLRTSGFELYDVATLSGRPRDGRLRLGDVVFVRRDSALMQDVSEP